MDPYAQQPHHTLHPPQSPYHFILDPQKPSKPKRFGFGGGPSFGMMIALIVGGALLLMLILGIVATIIGGSKASTSDFVSLAQTQNELVRISSQGVTDAVQQTTKNLAVTAQYGILTQQQQVLDYLARNGKKVGTKEIALKQNAQTDLQFKTATATSTFDLVFSKTIQNQLNDYANTLKQLFNTSKDPAEREQLAKYYEQTQLLISQVPYTQDSLNTSTQ